MLKQYNMTAFNSRFRIVSIIASRERGRPIIIFSAKNYGKDSWLGTIIRIIKERGFVERSRCAPVLSLKIDVYNPIPF
jgi:hypothetical protein